MKKKAKRIFLMILLISFALSPMKDYFVQAQSNSNSFFEIEKVEVTKDDEITMIINLNQIDYESFNFKLESNSSLLNVEVNDNIDENVENLKQNSNIFSFDFNKENSNLTSIVLNYCIPENLEVGEQITFKAIITNKNADDEVLESSYIVSIKGEEIEDNNQEVEDNNDDNTSDEKTQNDNNKSNGNSNQNKENITNVITNNQTESKKKSSMNRTSVTKKSSFSPSSSNSKKNQVSYNGSDNNYLKSLIVNNYQLNKEFKKESLTYFISVEDDVTSLSISAVAENSNSKVYINGNSGLKTGLNKVLITVVAENGNTKNYRIYVTKS